MTLVWILAGRCAIAVALLAAFFWFVLGGKVADNAKNDAASVACGIVAGASFIAAVLALAGWW